MVRFACSLAWARLTDSGCCHLRVHLWNLKERLLADLLGELPDVEERLGHSGRIVLCGAAPDRGGPWRAAREHL